MPTNEERKSNPGKWLPYFREYQRKYRQRLKSKEPQKYHQLLIKNRERERLRYERIYSEIRGRLFTLLGSRCSKCGYCNSNRALEIDHVNGDGEIERKKYGTLIKYYKGVLEQVENGSNKYQTLCANCHAIKTYEENHTV